MELSLKHERSQLWGQGVSGGSPRAQPGTGCGSPGALPLPWGRFIWRMNENLLSGSTALAYFLFLLVLHLPRSPPRAHIFTIIQKTNKFFFNLLRPFPGVPILPWLSSSEGLEAQRRPCVANGRPWVSRHRPPGQGWCCLLPDLI